MENEERFTVRLEGAVAHFYENVVAWCDEHPELEAQPKKEDNKHTYLSIPGSNRAALVALLTPEDGEDYAQTSPPGLYLASVPARKSHMPTRKFPGDKYKETKQFLASARIGTTPLGALPSELYAAEQAQRANYAKQFNAPQPAP